MKFVVLADEERWNALRAAAPGEEWQKAADIRSFKNATGADAYFDLRDERNPTDFTDIVAPVFINSVVYTLSEIKSRANIIRVNAWPGFTEKETWEISGEVSAVSDAVLKTLHKKFIAVNDVPGFVSARIIAMIINEAFFARGENISSEADIDTAMKLGTNYPYGPFEWGRKIGLQNIYALLNKLSEEDKKYLPAPELEKEKNLHS